MVYMASYYPVRDSNTILLLFQLHTTYTEWLASSSKPYDVKIVW